MRKLLTFKSAVVGAWLLLVAIGCELESLEKPVIVPSVKREFYVDMFEQLSSQHRSLQLLLESIERQPCRNTIIDKSVVTSGQRLQVSLKSIVQPVDCLPGEAPAVAVADLGALPDGVYSLTIDLQNVVFNEGTLIVTRENYLLRMPRENGIALLRTELLRVPAQTIWGYAIWETAADEAIVQTFVFELQQLTQERAYRAGHYGHFTINPADGRVVVRQQPVTPTLRSFLYNLEAPNEAALRNLIDRYRRDYAGKIIIRLYDSNGQEW
ncbi:MAG TPA: hypothetical protein PKD70_06470 [Saprospiraceae bacterium]|nr:hypothetical protein [Saprospiraceae bacterium]HMP13503.1 hypothetical protein [Saprospiraceae bacterium]